MLVQISHHFEFYNIYAIDPINAGIVSSEFALLLLLNTYPCLLISKGSTVCLQFAFIMGLYDPHRITGFDSKFEQKCISCAMKESRIMPGGTLRNYLTFFTIALSSSNKLLQPGFDCLSLLLKTFTTSSLR